MTRTRPGVAVIPSFTQYQHFFLHFGTQFFRSHLLRQLTHTRNPSFHEHWTATLVDKMTNSFALSGLHSSSWVPFPPRAPNSTQATLPHGWHSLRCAWFTNKKMWWSYNFFEQTNYDLDNRVGGAYTKLHKLWRWRRLAGQGPSQTGGRSGHVCGKECWSMCTFASISVKKIDSNVPQKLTLMEKSELYPTSENRSRIRTHRRTPRKF